MMIPIPIHTLATIFLIAGWGIGITSLGMLAYCGLQMLRWRKPTPAGDLNVGPNPDAILLTLKVMTKTMGAVGSIASKVSQAIIQMLAAAAGFALAFALLLLLTGHGLTSQATWARMLAGLLLLLVIVISLFLFRARRASGRIIKLLVLLVGVLGLYSLWANRIS